MSRQYDYLKLLLRNILLLDLDEYALTDTREYGLVCSFLGMKLSSAFQPVQRPDGKVVGREALLRARLLEHGEMTPDDAFEKAVHANRLVQFDRLVRIVHLMNHASSFAEHELLFLNVHSELLGSVNDHGRTFEKILHFYSVPTSRVVIEFKETSNQKEDVLAAAARNYRSLGYRIAVDDFGAAHSSLDGVIKLRPDFVKLDGALIKAAAHLRSAADSLGQLVKSVHKASIQVAVKNIETGEQLGAARNAGADILQGNYLGRPEFVSAARGKICRNERLAA
jgi:EAL domain-containing protein (putative c-di-GMP-specific phosphodiesterase class I)